MEGILIEIRDLLREIRDLTINSHKSAEAKQDDLLGQAEVILNQLPPNMRAMFDPILKARKQPK